MNLQGEFGITEERKSELIQFVSECIMDTEFVSETMDRMVEKSFYKSLSEQEKLIVGFMMGMLYSDGVNDKIVMN